MSTNLQEVEPMAPAARKHRWIDVLARESVVARLRKIQRGSLHLFAEAQEWRFGAAVASEPTAVVRIHDQRAFAEIALGGAIGAAEAYALGYWDADDLTAAMRILLRNRGVLDGLETGAARFSTPLRRLAHFLNRNTRAGSRRNIAAHYDLGNDFFALWLDDSLMYSAAVFPHPAATLEEAAAAKNDLICRKLRLAAGDRVLEIGTGWGGFALHAASHYRCHVTTVTISREQYELARRRVQYAGLANRVEVLLADYRELEPAVHGTFDKLVSIEMIEAVGHAFQPELLRKCAQMLHPAGDMLLQAITISDQQYDRARRSVDFIQRHIFPGSCLTSLTRLSSVLTQVTDLRIAHVEDIGPHYAKTLAHWRARFEARASEIRALGFPESFLRMWLYYFCYCEAGFLERVIGDVQLLLVKPDSRIEYPSTAAALS